MNNTVTIFLPTRKGSERIKNKNTCSFADYTYGGLLELKLDQLVKIKNINEIVLSTNDPESIQVGKAFHDKFSRLNIVNRPEKLAASHTSLTDLINHAAEVSKSDNILWTHVTSPFIDYYDYEKAINEYYKRLKEGFDSLMSVKKLSTFIWDAEKNDIINRQTDEKWPRTQDLKPFYEIDSGFFIASKEIYLSYNDRIGEKPFLYELDDIKSFDIDWPIDFKLAEIIHRSFYNKYLP